MKAFLLCTVLISFVLGSIHIRPESAKEVLVKIGQQVQIDLPDFDFTDIYSRQIRHVNQQKQQYKMDDLCKQANPYVDIKEDLHYEFASPTNKSKAVTFDFEDIKKRRGVLDAIVRNRTFTYVALENATLWILQNDNNKSLILNRSMSFPGVAEIEYGEFHEISDTQRLLFITEANMYLINSFDIIKMEGYHPTSNSFSGAVSINQKYLAVGSQTLGVVFYQILSDRYVKQAGGYAASFFNRTSIQVQDVEYEPTTSTLFILDTHFGVFMAKLNVSAEGHVGMTLLPKSIKRKYCDNMLLIDGELYITCQDFIKYGIFTDTAFTKLEQPQFKVLKMSSKGNMMVLTGFNQFKVYHNDRLVEDLDYDYIDEFLLIDNKSFVAVGEYSITYGRFTITPPIIRCHTNNPKVQGLVPAIVHTQAQCNPQYFKKNKIDLDYNTSDTCVYTVPVNLIFWQPKDLTLMPFKVVSIILIVLVIGFWIWWCRVKGKEQDLKGLLRAYRSVGNPSNQSKYTHFEQEKEDKEVQMVPSKKDQPPAADNV